MNAQLAPAPVKESKAARLERMIVEAEAKLATETTQLTPQIDAAEREQAQLRTNYERLCKLTRAAYEARVAANRACETRLGLDSIALATELTAFVVARGLLLANVEHIRRTYVARFVDADEQVLATRAAHDQADRAERAAYGRYNSYQKLEDLQRKLRASKKAVADLKNELARLPHRNTSAKERRAAERADVLMGEQTSAALEALGEFTFTGLKKPEGA